MKKKLAIILVLALMVTVLPVQNLVSADFVDGDLDIELEDKDGKTPNETCFEVTELHFFGNSNLIKPHILYWDGTYVGTLYEIHREMKNQAWYVTYRGVVCDRNVIESIPKTVNNK